MTKRILIFMAGALLVSLTGTGCSKNEGQSVAVVQGVTISEQEFHDWLEVKPSVQVSVQGQLAEFNVNNTLGFQALQDIITQKLVLQLAADEGVAPTDKDVDDEIKFRDALTPGFIRSLTDAGMTLRQIKEQTRQDLAKERIVTKGITVTAEETDQYIRDNPKAFMDPATVDLLWILVRDPAKKAKVDQELGSGQTFSTVATQYSDDPEAKDNQGRYKGRAIDQFAPDLKAKIEATPEGGTTQWISTTAGSAKFLVEKKNPAKPMNLDANRKKQVQRQLALARGQAASDLQQRIVQLMKDRKIEIKDKKYEKLWNDFKKQVEASSKKQTTAAPANNSAPAAGGGTAGAPGGAPAAGTTGN